jgi:inorganic pyrophosphatase
MCCSWSTPYINCKIIGVLETKDDAGVDPKLILLPSDKIDPVWAAYDNINELSKSTKEDPRPLGGGDLLLGNNPSSR